MSLPASSSSGAIVTQQLQDELEQHLNGLLNSADAEQQLVSAQTLQRAVSRALRDAPRAGKGRPLMKHFDDAVTGLLLFLRGNRACPRDVALALVATTHEVVSYNKALTGMVFAADGITVLLQVLSLFPDDVEIARLGLEACRDMCANAAKGPLVARLHGGLQRVFYVFEHFAARAKAAPEGEEEQEQQQEQQRQEQKQASASSGAPRHTKLVTVAMEFLGEMLYKTDHNRALVLKMKALPLLFEVVRACESHKLLTASAVVMERLADHKVVVGKMLERGLISWCLGAILNVQQRNNKTTVTKTTNALLRTLKNVAKSPAGFEALTQEDGFARVRQQVSREQASTAKLVGSLMWLIQTRKFEKLTAKVRAARAKARSSIRSGAFPFEFRSNVTTTDDFPGDPVNRERFESLKAADEERRCAAEEDGKEKEEEAEEKEMRPLAPTVMDAWDYSPELWPEDDPRHAAQRAEEEALLAKTGPVNHWPWPKLPFEHPRLDVPMFTADPEPLVPVSSDAHVANRALDGKKLVHARLFSGTIAYDRTECRELRTHFMCEPASVESILPEPVRQHLRVKPFECKTKQLRFESRFESGNLHRAIRTGDTEYDLILAGDINAIGRIQWFYFAVANMEAGVKYKFNIINLEKNSSVFQHGMAPSIYSVAAAKKRNIGWRRAPNVENVAYYQNFHRRYKAVGKTDDPSISDEKKKQQQKKKKEAEEAAAAVASAAAAAAAAAATAPGSPGDSSSSSDDDDDNDGEALRIKSPVSGQESPRRAPVDPSKDDSALLDDDEKLATLLFRTGRDDGGEEAAAAAIAAKAGGTHIDEKEYMYTLTWTMTFETANDTVFIAHAYPYTYSRLKADLAEATRRPGARDVLRRQLLSKTRTLNDCELLTITDFSAPLEERAARPVAYVSSRVHPGETTASWVSRGMLNFLLGDTAEAQELRRRVVFKVVPMLNPDGVINGNYRCSLAGADLNRRYLGAHPVTFPTVWATKNLVIALSAQRPVIFFCDVHSHSKMRNFCLYGCDPLSSRCFVDPKPPEETLHVRPVHEAVPNVRPSASHPERIFPALLERHAPESFSFGACTFDVSKGKASAGRVVMWRELGLWNCYTLETTFACASFGKYSALHFQTPQFEQMGDAVARSVLALVSDDPTVVEEAVKFARDYNATEAAKAAKAVKLKKVPPVARKSGGAASKRASGSAGTGKKKRRAAAAKKEDDLQIVWVEKKKKPEKEKEKEKEEQEEDVVGVVGGGG